MSTRMKSRVVLTGLTMLVALYLSVPTAHMQGLPSDIPIARFGMVGIARGQVARLNAVNELSGISPEPFRVRMGFVDAEGRPIFDRMGRVVSMVVILMPGQGAWIDLDASDALTGVELRKQIRPVVSHPPDPIIPTDTVIPIVATLELYNRLTGRTEVLYSPVGGTTPDDNQPPR